MINGVFVVDDGDGSDRGAKGNFSRRYRFDPAFRAQGGHGRFGRSESHSNQLSCRPKVQKFKAPFVDRSQLCSIRDTDMAKRPRESDTMQTEAGPSTLSPQPSTSSVTPLKDEDLQRLIPQVRLSPPDLPTSADGQKRYYRQRAHANVFLDHALD